MDTFHLNSIHTHSAHMYETSDILLACLNWAGVIMVLCVDMLFLFHFNQQIANKTHAHSFQMKNISFQEYVSIRIGIDYVVDRRSKVLIWMRMNISRDA